MQYRWLGVTLCITFSRWIMCMDSFQDPLNEVFHIQTWQRRSHLQNETHSQQEQCHPTSMGDLITLGMFDEGYTEIPVSFFKRFLSVQHATQRSAFDPHIIYFEAEIPFNVTIIANESLWKNAIWRNKLYLRLYSEKNQSGSILFNIPLYNTTFTNSEITSVSGVIRRTIGWRSYEWEASIASSQMIAFHPVLILEGPTRNESLDVFAQLESLVKLHIQSGILKYFPQPGKLTLDDNLDGNILFSPYGGKAVTFPLPRELHKDPCFLLGSSHAVVLHQMVIPKNKKDLAILFSNDSSSDYSVWYMRESHTLPRILCIVYTISSHHEAYITAQRGTWLRKCTSYLIISNETDVAKNIIRLPFEGDENYSNIWQKLQSLWKYIYKHYRDEYEWFLLGGDDLYVIMENVYGLLQSKDIVKQQQTKLGVYLGRSMRFNITADPKILTQGNDSLFSEEEFQRLEASEATYANGGAGYVLDTVALNILVKKLTYCLPSETEQRTEDADKDLQYLSCKASYRTSIEDALIGQCLYRSSFQMLSSNSIFHSDNTSNNSSYNIKEEKRKKMRLFRRERASLRVTDTRDDSGRERFHILPPGVAYTVSEEYIREKHWMGLFSEHAFQNLSWCCAPTSISYHYMRPFYMFAVHSFLYDCPRAVKDAFYARHGREFYNWTNVDSEETFYV